MSQASDSTDLSARLAAVDESIAAAARRAGRDPSSITRIVVTKFHPASLIRELHSCGVRDVGENRQQELSAKTAETADLGELRWHFVGQAQTKKARAIRQSAAVVHSVDRERLADAFERVADDDRLLDVLMQVNLTDDEGRGGVNPDGIESLAEHIAGLSTLRLRGIMAVAPLDEEPARAFARLHGMAQQLLTVVPDADWISAGMTADFVEAINAGATHLRIGSAITGSRPDRG
ncbi:YggS family pyridoxal phosphate-dependent enzyme [Microbacterium sp. YY-01]|uniref:YggS family pyridoxal phosphate-dependent enzyme n=1 Tax=Microbacterium sp. YY-01 TaxID=3421634 RepID=UPI003D175E8D